jgi:hypothetical protein
VDVFLAESALKRICIRNCVAKRLRTVVRHGVRDYAHASAIVQSQDSVRPSSFEPDCVGTFRLYVPCEEERHRLWHRLCFNDSYRFWM